jgi:hypothetical protein
MLEARNALSSIFDTLTLKQFAEGTLARYKADGMLPPIIEMLEKPASRRAANKAGGEPEYLI